MGKVQQARVSGDVLCRFLRCDQQAEQGEDGDGGDTHGGVALSIAGPGTERLSINLMRRIDFSGGVWWGERRCRSGGRPAFSGAA